MNRQMFKQNNSIILSHLKINWKLILFFTLFWLIISVVVLSMTLTSHVDEVKTPVIGEYTVMLRTLQSGHGTTLTSLSKMLNWGLFSVPGIVFFSIFIILFINKTLVKEINNGQINSWVTLPLSRKQILFSKTLYIILSNFIVFIPSYLLVLIFAGISHDASQWFANVVLYGIEFMLFISLLTVIYTLISILLIEKAIVSNIINSLIIFWILVSWITLIIYDTDPIKYEELKYVQYVSLQSLIVCPVKFSMIEQAKPIITQINSYTTLTLTPFKYIEINKIAVSLCSLAMPFFIAITILLNNCLFKRKDLHI